MPRVCLLPAFSTPRDLSDKGFVGVAWSPDGSLLASAGSYDDETIRVWRVADGTVVRSYTFRSEPDSLAFRPDGKLLAVGIFEDLYLWRVP